MNLLTAKLQGQSQEMISEIPSKRPSRGVPTPRHVLTVGWVCKRTRRLITITRWHFSLRIIRSCFALYNREG